MSKPFPLQTLLDLAKERNDAAAAQLGVVNGHERDMQTRLKLLIDYRSEYSARLACDAQSGMDSAEWRNFRQFIDTIDTAIDQQREIAASAMRQVETGRQHWQTQKRRLGSFDTLSQRFRSDQRANEARLEQKEQDNFTLNKYLGSREMMGQP